MKYIMSKVIGASLPNPTDGKEAKPVYHPTLLALFERF